jgi:hypothetical protein
VLRTFAGRLDDPESVKVEIATRDMGRSDSILRAKSEKEDYVVSLQLRSDTMTGSNSDPYNVEIAYAVFAPITAKQVTSGRTYPGAYRNKGVILSPKSPVYGDYALNQAAKDAAERILDHFHVGMVRP